MMNSDPRFFFFLQLRSLVFFQIHNSTSLIRSLCNVKLFRAHQKQTRFFIQVSENNPMAAALPLSPIPKQDAGVVDRLEAIDQWRSDLLNDRLTAYREDLAAWFSGAQAQTPCVP